MKIPIFAPINFKEIIAHYSMELPSSEQPQQIDLDPLVLQRKAAALAESASQSKRGYEDIAGNFWLLQLRPEFHPLLDENAKNTFSWLNLLVKKKMGTNGIVSFCVTEGTTRKMGCFCVLKTPRKLHELLDKVGDICTVDKMQSGVKFSPLRTHPEYMRLAAIGALTVEQEGVISEHLMRVEEAGEAAAAEEVRETQQADGGVAAGECVKKMYCRRNGQRSVGCQVFFLVVFARARVFQDCTCFLKSMFVYTGGHCRGAGTNADTAAQ